MLKYILKRFFQIVLTLWIYLTVVFLLLYLQPGDITDFFITTRTPPEARAQIQTQFGLDKPVWEQYFSMVSNFVTFNLGVSFKQYPTPVMEIISERLPRTVLLFVTASLISFMLGFVLGRIIGWRRGAAIEYASTLTGVVLWTVFTPWFALLMIWIFAFNFHLFPLGGFNNPDLMLGVDKVASISCRGAGGTDCTNYVFNQILLTASLALCFAGLTFLISRLFQEWLWRWALNVATWVLICVGTIAYWTQGAGAVETGIFATRALTIVDLARDILQHLLLPIITLALVSFAGTMLLMRNTMLESMREDYIMAARAKGLPDKAVRDRHAARNALLPVLTYFIIGLALSIDGSIFIEKIFSWKGMGWTLLQSAIDRDYPMVIGALVITGFFALIAHLIADILYALLDPRIRYD